MLGEGGVITQNPVLRFSCTPLDWSIVSVQSQRGNTGHTPVDSLSEVMTSNCLIYSISSLKLQGVLHDREKLVQPESQIPCHNQKPREAGAEVAL